MRHYNQILDALAEPGSYEPVFDIDTRNVDILSEMWIEGFVQAMELAPDGWRRISASDNPLTVAALNGVAKLRAIANGETRLSRSKQDQMDPEGA